MNLLSKVAAALQRKATKLDDLGYYFGSEVGWDIAQM